jgi:alpha-glucosidase
MQPKRPRSPFLRLKAIRLKAIRLTALRLLIPATAAGCGPSHETSQLRTSDLIYVLPVAAYADSDGDGIGDINGVRAHLDHLAGLGVATVQLMPLEPADEPSRLIPAGTGIDAALGTQSDLAALSSELHEMGMTLEVQVPLNAVSCRHPWYSAAIEGQGRIQFHDFGGPSYFPTDDQRYYYAEGGLEHPDLDWDDAGLPGDRAASLTALLEAGVDGVLFRGFTAEGERTPIAVAEALSGELHVQASGLGIASAPLEPVVETLRLWAGLGAVADLPRALAWEAAARDSDVAWVEDVIRDWGEDVEATRPFLGDGDRARFASRVRDDATRRTLMTLHLLGPGRPTLYYGEELDLGDSTTLPVDAPWRAPMPWNTDTNCGFTQGNPWFVPDPACLVGWNVADEASDPKSMLRHVQWLTDLRARSEDSAIEQVASGYPDVMAFRRGSLLVIGSVGASSRTLFIPGEAAIDAVTGAEVGERFEVPALGWRVLDELPSRRGRP